MELPEQTTGCHSSLPLFKLRLDNNNNNNISCSGRLIFLFDGRSTNSGQPTFTSCSFQLESEYFWLSIEPRQVAIEDCCACSGVGWPPHCIVVVVGSTNEAGRSRQRKRSQRSLSNLNGDSKSTSTSKTTLETSLSTQSISSKCSPYKRYSMKTSHCAMPVKGALMGSLKLECFGENNNRQVAVSINSKQPTVCPRQCPSKRLSDSDSDSVVESGKVS